MTLFDEMFEDGVATLAETHGEASTYTDLDGNAISVPSAIWGGSTAAGEAANDGTSDVQRQIVKVPESELAVPVKRGVLTRNSAPAVKWTIDTIDHPPGGLWVLNCVRADLVEHHRPGRFLRG